MLHETGFSVLKIVTKDLDIVNIYIGLKGKLKDKKTCWEKRGVFYQKAKQFKAVILLRELLYQVVKYR